MPDKTDWEALMDGAFGRRSRPTAETSARRDAEQARRELEELMARQPAAPAALQKNAARLADAAADQAEQIRRLGGEMTENLRRDGLLPQEKPAPAAPDTAFAGLAEQLEQTVIGQPDFVRALVRAFRRPFVLGYAPGGARNTILIWGGEGTGRHFALQTLAGLLAEKGVLDSANLATMDLARYPGPGQEKLFLQDLYAALTAPGQILVFDHYEECHPGFLNLLAGLVQEGKAPLASRYVVQKGMLVDAGTALVPGAVGELTARDKYLVFFSHKGPDAMAERFGGPFAAALGDVCATAPFTPESLRVLAAGQLNRTVRRAKERLGVTLIMTEEVRDLAAGMADVARGAEPIVAFCDRVYKAVGQYLLEREPQPGLTVALSVQEGQLLAAFGADEARPLLAEVDESAGALARVEAELDKIVGLEEVKTYVRGLADHVRVQRRRKAQGLPAGSLTMHMIFTGNPGTGKTTIARLISQYLKAVGALRGGQLVEVSRADLVGRYVGHTAPLTEQVIRSALGGVLFIDEAYSLYRGKEDSFGLEAIDTLVKGMEDHRDELVVVLAGYSREMAQFLTANSGLASRFAQTIEFPDYTAEELLKITELQAAGRGYVLDEGCKAPLLAYYARRQAENAAKAGNGRMARNTLEQAILNQSRRLVADPDAPLDRLLIGDFELEE
ncbi:stage V sporulation protein K [Gemmiger sp. An120]|uniref:AAA family ATPase n=1 Tax=Gemmiger sp. An120 TaxID=1965549 RepID=UPI000B3A1208|nr:AAA family ATPase [Gemmiger sp. An120]OUQ38775.1 stage V sporulation protein K [Gemmiger sp. An120]